MALFGVVLYNFTLWGTLKRFTCSPVVLSCWAKQVSFSFCPCVCVCLSLSLSVWLSGCRHRVKKTT